MSIPELGNTTKIFSIQYSKKIFHYDEQRIASLQYSYFSSVFASDDDRDCNIANANYGIGSIYFTGLDIVKLIDKLSVSKA